MSKGKLAEYAAVEIDKLTLDPSNARKHPEANLHAIKGSLLKFGQQKPIVVTRKNVVIAGNGTLAAAKELGWKKIDVKYTDLSGPEAIAFALADNRTSELAEWDMEMLGGQIQSLYEHGFEVSDIGFDLHKYIKSLNEIAPDPLAEAMREPDYSVIDDQDPDLDNFKNGVRKAIQIEFELEHYDDAVSLVKYWREKGAYVGLLLIEKLEMEKLRHENA